MKMSQALRAALRRDPELLAMLTEPLKRRAEDEASALSTVVQTAEALEPLIASAVERRPSRLNKIGLKSAHVLASLTADDAEASGRLVALASGTEVGVVFVDIAGFTRFTEQHGDDAAIELLRRLEPLLAEATALGKGELVKKLGDGFLLAFPSSSQAVRGGVHLRDAVVAARAERQERDPRLRIAVHSGEPLVQEDDLLGLDVNIAARLLDHCDPDEVIVSDAARERAVRRLKKLDFVHQRSVKIRGLSTPMTVWSAFDRPS